MMKVSITTPTICSDDDTNPPGAPTIVSHSTEVTVPAVNEYQLPVRFTILYPKKSLSSD